MRWSVLLFSLCFSSVAYADPVGVFTATSGEVQVLRGQSYLAAASGVEVAADDIVETGAGASAQIDLDDGSVVALGPDSRLALSDYKLGADKSVVSAALDVLSGWVRFAVAKVRPEAHYNIHTPVLTVGIRGTEGIIEAQNDQGGLHLHEGAVDVVPLGQDVTGAQAMRVNGGEYIERTRGKGLAKHAQPPVAFQNRLPPQMQQKLARRAHQLHKRGVPPRVIRQMTREDARRYLERHPHMNEKMRRRFQGPQAGPHPHAPATEMQRHHPQQMEGQHTANQVPPRRMMKHPPERASGDESNENKPQRPTPAER